LQNPKLCGFYRFQKEYLDELIRKKAVVIKSQQIDEEEVGSDGNVQDEECNELEKKLANLTWKMNCLLVVFGIFVLVMVVRSIVMA
jgi:RNase P/RNase MRP subunit p29